MVICSTGLLLTALVALISALLLATDAQAQSNAGEPPPPSQSSPRSPPPSPRLLPPPPPLLPAASPPPRPLRPPLPPRSSSPPPRPLRPRPSPPPPPTLKHPQWQQPPSPRNHMNWPPPLLNSLPGNMAKTKKRRGLNLGKKVGLSFVGIVVIMQFGVVGFLAYKRMQLYKVRD